MARIIQYRPAFVTGFENEFSDFNSTDELFEIPFVRNFREGVEGSNFFQYSYSEYSQTDEQRRFVLIAEYDKGKHWFVIGFTDNNEIIKTLPRWEQSKKEQ
jgi:hypothetical protein